MRTERNRWHASWSYINDYTILPTLCHCGNIVQHFVPGKHRSKKRNGCCLVAFWDSMIIPDESSTIQPKARMIESILVKNSMILQANNKHGSVFLVHLFFKLGKICQWNTELPEVSKTLHVASSGLLVCGPARDYDTRRYIYHININIYIYTYGSWQSLFVFFPCRHYSFICCYYLLCDVRKSEDKRLQLDPWHEVFLTCVLLWHCAVLLCSKSIQHILRQCVHPL